MSADELGSPVGRAYLVGGRSIDCKFSAGSAGASRKALYGAAELPAACGDYY